jgi:hypothetical protein
MRIRVLKTPPPAVIDSFDVRSLRAGHVYDLDMRMANYLVIAGYAARAEDEQTKTSSAAEAGKSEPYTPT